MAIIGQFFWSRRLHSSRRNSSEPTQMHKRIFNRCRRGNVHQFPAFSAELVQPACSSHGICRDVHDQVFPAAHDCTRSIRAPCGSLTARFRRTYSTGVSAYRVHPTLVRFLPRWVASRCVLRPRVLGPRLSTGWRSPSRLNLSLCIFQASSGR